MHLKTLPGRLETERCAFYLAKEGQFPGRHDLDFLCEPSVWRWRDDGFRLRRLRDDRPRGDRCVCVSLSFGGTLLSFGRAARLICSLRALFSRFCTAFGCIGTTLGAGIIGAAVC